MVRETVAGQINGDNVQAPAVVEEERRECGEGHGVVHEAVDTERLIWGGAVAPLQSTDLQAKHITLPWLATVAQRLVYGLFRITRLCVLIRHCTKLGLALCKATACGGNLSISYTRKCIEKE